MEIFEQHSFRDMDEDGGVIQWRISFWSACEVCRCKVEIWINISNGDRKEVIGWFDTKGIVE